MAAGRAYVRQGLGAETMTEPQTGASDEPLAVDSVGKSDGEAVASGQTKTMSLEVFRYRPDEESEPTFQTYEIPFRKDWVVLDALNWIKDNVDGTLSYRWNCRMGVCGSCGMLVNGTPQLTCAAFLRNYYPKPIRVEPLSYFPVERDLMVLRAVASVKETALCVAASARRRG